MSKANSPSSREQVRLKKTRETRRLSFRERRIVSD
jgi:hypothetical protein